MKIPPSITPRTARPAPPRAGDIGEPMRHIELEPITAPARREQPAPAVTPQPEPVPA